MRTLASRGLALLLLTWPLGCASGGATAAPARPPAVADSSPQPAADDQSEKAGSGAAEESTPVEDAGATPAATTTTATLDQDEGQQGTKLAEIRPDGPDAAAAPMPKGASPSPSKAHRGHDPGRGPADIRAIVIAHRQEARACYDQAIADHPGIGGDLVIQWTIDPKGAVTQVSADLQRSQITEPGVIDCVGNVIKAIRFAPSPGGFETRAFYPFNFRPRHAGATPTSAP